MSDQVITFTEEGEFQACRAACKWCEDNGFSSGSMARHMPIGLLKGDWQIAKWYNLTKKEQSQLDGTITCVSSFREAPIHIVIKDMAVKS